MSGRLTLPPLRFQLLRLSQSPFRGPRSWPVVLVSMHSFIPSLGHPIFQDEPQLGVRCCPRRRACRERVSEAPVPRAQWLLCRSVRKQHSFASVALTPSPPCLPTGFSAPNWILLPRRMAGGPSHAPRRGGCRFYKRGHC